jgi:GT2 family glycosyltransferase
MKSVTVAIPLHASARWVENVIANVQALPPIVTEILISDQTLVDDAAERIRARLTDDPRVRIETAAAGLGFVAHYEQLLARARGEYFMWMPHDDIFDPGWVPILAAALDAHPKAWLAFGRLEWVETDGVTPFWNWPLGFARGALDDAQATRLMVEGKAFHAFRGVFRREVIRAAEVRMESATSIANVDQEWVFTVALRGGIVFDDRAVTWKRRVEGSTSTTAAWRSERRGSMARAALRLLQRDGPPGMRGWTLQMQAVSFAAALRTKAAIAWLLPRPIKRTLQRIVTTYVKQARTRR